MKYLALLISLVVIILGSIACKEDAAENVDIRLATVEFIVNENFIGAESQIETPTEVVVPIELTDSTEIVNYVRINDFQLAEGMISDIKVSIHQVLNIKNEQDINLDSLFASGPNTDAKFIVDQTDFRGFGVTICLVDSENEEWYSYNANNFEFEINQSESEFQIHALHTPDSSVYLFANFNCMLHNTNGEALILKEGALVFKLQ